MSQIKKGIYVKCFRVQDTEENIWVQEGRGKEDWQRLSNVKFHDLFSSPLAMQKVRSKI